jgi:hypothetical protein
MKKLFSLILVASFALALFAFWYWQKGDFSKEVLRIEILAPDAVRFGEEIEYLVKFKNNGDINLEDARLIFEFPENSLPLDDNESLRREQLIEVIYPGQESVFSYKAKLFGVENEKKIAKATLNYRPKNLKGRFESSTTKTVVLQTASLNFEIDIPSKVEVGKEVKFSINYFSNIDYPLSDLKIFVDYPVGFEFLNAKPTTPEKNEWSIPFLNKTEGGRLEISGIFSGNVGEGKLIKARIGIWLQDKFVLLKETSRGIELIKPSIFITQFINGNPQYVASPGDLLHYEIIFKNIGQDTFKDLFMVVKLEGKVYDYESIKSLTGIFKRGDSSIIFDGKTVPALKILAPQDEGRVEFWVQLKNDWDVFKEGQNQKVSAIVILSQAREEFVTKVSSKLELVAKAYFNDEVFGNSGPFPLEGGKETTFTVIWQIKNFYNDVSNVKIRAKLPSNVSLTGKVFPEDAKFTFDSQSRELVWEVGQLQAGQGLNNQAPNFAFQVSVLPETNQEKNLLILENIRVSAEDEWTNTFLETKIPDLRTDAISS